jgi:hypothetical protein
MKCLVTGAVGFICLESGGNTFVTDCVDATVRACRPRWEKPIMSAAAKPLQSTTLP